jgi:hypothetical protein
MAKWTHPVGDREVDIETSDPGQPKKIRMRFRDADGNPGDFTELSLMDAQMIRLTLASAISTLTSEPTGGETS